MLLLLIPIFLFAFFTFLAVVSDFEEGPTWLMAISGSVLILVLVFWGLHFFNSYNDYSDVTAYMESGIYQEYQTILQAQIDAGVIGDISNTRTGEPLIGSVQAWYDRIQEINKIIVKARVWNDSWWLDWYCMDWPEYPDLINGETIRAMNFQLLKKDVQNMTGIPVIVSP